MAEQIVQPLSFPFSLSTLSSRIGFMAKRLPNYFRVDKREARVFEGDLPKQSYGRYRHAQQVAIDLEYKTLHPNQFDIKTIQLAAIQIATPEFGAVIVRVLPNKLPLYMLEVLKNPEIQKVFHFAFGDCSLITEKWGITVTNVACTKIAAKVLFNDPQKSTSLVSLLPQFLNIHVSKEEQLSDWFVKTLSKEQVEYAARDVLYLVPLLEKLSEELEKAHKLDEVRAIWNSLPQVVADEVSGLHKKNNWRDPIIQYK